MASPEGSRTCHGLNVCYSPHVVPLVIEYRHVDTDETRWVRVGCVNSGELTVWLNQPSSPEQEVRSLGLAAEAVGTNDDG